MAPAKGAAILLIGGTVGTARLALGVWMAERIGRVRTIVSLGFAGVAGVLAFYWGPPAECAWPALWLIVANSWFSITGRGLLVAANSAVTELFPTALRGTIMGWILLYVAFAAITAQAAIALLAARMGGLSNVVGWLSLMMIPYMLIWGFFIEETRGLSLEVAAHEE